MTNDDLANALRRAKARGVAVKIISDDDLLTMKGSDVKTLHDEGFPVRVDLNRNSQMHHKFAVIDDFILITGSFNWTKQAVDKNQENLVILDDPVLARSYTDQFNKIWEEFAPSENKYFGGEKIVNENLPIVKETYLEEAKTSNLENPKEHSADNEDSGKVENIVYKINEVLVRDKKSEYVGELSGLHSDEAKIAEDLSADIYLVGNSDIPNSIVRDKNFDHGLN